MRGAAYVLASLVAGSVFCAEPPAFPLAKGTVWVYRGTIRDERPQRKITTTMQVVESLTTGRYEVAVIKGAPVDIFLFACSPHTMSDVHALVRDGGTWWSVLAPDMTSLGSEAEVRELIREPVLVQPLHGRESLGCNPQRANGMYCWWIGETQQRLKNVTGVDPKPVRPTFTLTFRSLPDHAIREIVPGIGITRIEYEHHGTPCHIKLHLVEIRPGS